MAYKNKKTGSKKLSRYAALLVVALLLIGGGVYALHRGKATPTAASKSTANNGIDYSPAKPSDNQANEQRKSSTKNGSGDTLNSPANTPTFSVTISRASTISGTQNISVAANVNGASSGSCIFNFSRAKDGVAVVSSPTVGLAPSNQSSMCPPTTVTMPDAGPWYVSVSVTSNNATASADWPDNPVKL